MGWTPRLNSCPCRFHEIDGDGSADVDSFLDGLFPFQHSHNEGQGRIGSASRNRLRTASQHRRRPVRDEPLFAQRVDSNLFDPLVQPRLPMSPDAGNVGSLQVRPTFRHRSKVYDLARLCHLPFLNPCDLLGELACLLPRRGDSEVHRV